MRVRVPAATRTGHRGVSARVYTIRARVRLRERISCRVSLHACTVRARVYRPRRVPAIVVFQRVRTPSVRACACVNESVVASQCMRTPSVRVCTCVHHPLCARLRVVYVSVHGDVRIAPCLCRHCSSGNAEHWRNTMFRYSDSLQSVFAKRRACYSTHAAGAARPSMMMVVVQRVIITNRPNGQKLTHF